MKKNIYFFQWVSDLGGADTRLKELIQLFSETGEYNLYSIPNDNARLTEQNNVNFLNKHNVKILSWDELPSKSDGIAISFCNFRLFSEKWRIEKIKSMGLKFIWSNDMMWITADEIEAINKNQIDVLIFTSEFHKFVLNQKSSKFNKIKNYIVPNYFHYPNYIEKLNKKTYLNDKFVVGKLSRADSNKYSENFPLLYDKINIANKHIRIMGWDQNLNIKYKWFNFNKNYWELLPENKETIKEFLSQLDLYIFNCHHNYIENQSRSLIEAQLLGIPAIVPNMGNFPNMIWNERTGFIYNTVEEFYDLVEYIYNNKNYYNNLSNNAKKITPILWCDKNFHLNLWNKIFSEL